MQLIDRATSGAAPPRRCPIPRHPHCPNNPNNPNNPPERFAPAARY